MNFKTVIGLEAHVQLKTKSKMFCSCSNSDDPMGDKRYANTRVCPVCMGLPGVLPVANRQAIEWTLKTGLALNAEIPEISKFDRKHYFYPDLPKGYQISQFDKPFAVGGKLGNINITRIHLEEDAGKLIHADDSSLVDLNRAGTPLMEIVTEPEINSPNEAKIFMQELRSILRYLDVSDADMEKGHLRADANISVSASSKLKTQSSNELGTPVEIKNLNSFRMVERALLYEEKRQRELIDSGEKIIKETRGWDDSKCATYSQRSKEVAQDYRYFPEPDIPLFSLESFNIDKIKKEIPELPSAKLQRYVNQYNISAQDAAFLAQDRELSAYFEVIAENVDGKLSANWVINELKLDGILIIKPEMLIELLKLIENGQISGKIAKEILIEMISSGKSAKIIIAEKGIKQVGDKSKLSNIIEKIIKDNPKVVADYKKGKVEALGFLVGLVMRETKGQANPQIVNKLLKDKLAPPSK